ncbi:MAG: MerR family transcriptional regulator [Miniphocaeibacter sp.]|uniref:MerR family transcriptional regulator n=1 Tax=Miniphocaeibacter sp. TaxID=3100973 RepID=UPI00180CA311|nr:MerR family transcriptional regulator [Gallicola sp.]
MKNFKQKYYTIGEIAKICNINIRTLHYYDSIDLVKPVKIVENSNYRLYSKGQIPVINSIKRLREMGLSLKDVKLFISLITIIIATLLQII